MPGFVSHTIMARDVYRKLEKKNVNLDYMVTYSLGGDLTKYAKCRYETHHKDMDKFIYDMADYIKENNLIDNREIMGVLYGHICHYVMDSVVHPLVRKMDKVCLKNKHNHTLIEVYYDNYLVNYRYQISKSEYLRNGILITKNNFMIDKMIDEIYIKTYNTKNIAKYYRFNLFLYRILRNTYIIFSDKLTNIVMGLNKFVSKNRDVDLVNVSRNVTYKNNLGKEDNSGLIDLYIKCLDDTTKYIDDINKYLEI